MPLVQAVILEVMPDVRASCCMRTGTRIALPQCWSRLQHIVMHCQIGSILCFKRGE